MNQSDENAETALAAAHDPLADLIRAVGRRPPPPLEHQVSVLAASRAAWQAKVRSRKRRRFAYALAASLAVASGSIAVVRMLDPVARAPAATLAIADGDVAFFSAESGAWEPLTGLGAQIRAGDRLRTGPSGRAALFLGDARSLRIDSDTELALAGPDSLSLLAGTLYVDSGNRPTAPVEIATSFGIVRDVGTQFEVRSTAQTLRVRVRTGSVLLMESPHTADLRSTAGQELELSRTGNLQLRAIAADAEQWQWAMALAPAADIENESILGYLKWIARETGKPLRFDSENTELRAQFERWSGDPQGLTPLQVLESIVATSDFVYEFADDGAMLIRRR